MLSIANPNPTAYNFADDEMQKTVMLEDDQSAIVNFSGTHTRTASVSGMLFIDEVDQNNMYDDGEPSITKAIAPLVAAGALDAEVVAGLLAKAKVVLRGPDLNTRDEIAINADGSFSTGESLMAGSYQVELPVNDDDVAAGLAAAGVAFAGFENGGSSMVVEVDAGGSATVNFPFRITMQTVTTNARMGLGNQYGDPVEGVKLALYARADGTGMLDEGTTDAMGMATFDFARMANTGPAGNDNIVFVKVMESGHDALVVSGNEFVEIAYTSTARLYAADAEKEAATLVNVAVAFDFWVKSIDMRDGVTVADGNMGLGGWNTVVYMGDPDAEGAMPLMMEDEDGEMVNATMPTDDGEDNMADLGKSSFAYTVDPADLADGGATFTMMAAMDDDVACSKDGKSSDQPDQCEMWEQGDALTYTHTGLELPPGADDDMLDLGPIRVTFTTQAVYVGVHRELDDRTGYTDFIGLGDGDGRPGKTAQGEITITLMTADSRGRLRTLEYDHDANPETDDEAAEKTAGASGMVSFKNIPADMEITVVADEGDGMVVVPDSRASREIDAFGDQLDDYPDGLIVGAFGAGSGARPDVWLCPLARQASDDPSEVCSTYAYKWATGTISGTIGGLRQGDKATVTLTPVNSNDDYADDLAAKRVVTQGAGDPVEYEFTGVADGRYMATLVANPGSWPANEAKGLEVMHDESDTDDDYTGASDTGNLSATDLRGVIRGRIANDSNGRSGLTSDESRAGVVVNLHASSNADSKGKRSPVAAVLATRETDEDGVYMFEGLTVGKHYFVEPQGTGLYTAVRNGNTGVKDQVPTGKTANDVIVTQALTRATLPPAPGSEPAIPTWDYNNSTATVGAADFVLLYKDGEVEGKVSDPSVRKAHARTVIELHQCKTSNYSDGGTPDDNSDDTAASQCKEFTGVVEKAEMDANGNWSRGGLREGLYEVIPDLPAGYISVNAAGGTAVDDPLTLHTQQFVELMGGRADDDTQTFHIKDRNAGSASALTTVTVNAAACTTAGFDATSNASNQCGHKGNGAFTVVVTASSGAVVRLSNLGDDDDVNTASMRSFQVNNGSASTVTLTDPGSEGFFVHVRSEDGYSTNGSAGLNNASTAGFHIRRDADVRVKTVNLTWSGDGIVLDRKALNLDPDGETDPVTGTTTLRVTVDKGARGTAAPSGTDAITVEAASMTTGFGTRSWEDATGTPPACPGSPTASTTGDAVTLPANAGTTKGTVAVCFTITDSDGHATNPDANTSNTRNYLLILTRK